MFKINGSKIRLFSWFHCSNDEPMLLTIEGKWLEAIAHMKNLNSWICFIQNKINFSFQFAFMVNYNFQPHLPLLALKKTSNNLSHKQKSVWKAKLSLLLRQLFLMIMSNEVWNASLILLNQNQFLNKNLLKHRGCW